MAKILVIEDHDLLRQLYGSALSEEKHEVMLACSGEGGVALALRERPDLVIMDLMLPGISGAEVAEQLRQSGVLPQTPLIIATSLGKEARSLADSLNAALLPKPFHLNQMMSEVNRALSRGGAPALVA